MKANPEEYRVDAVEKISGTARYIRDEHVPGLWYGGTVRSPFARAKILKIEFDPTFDWSQVVVATAKDIPKNYVSMLENDMPFLADEIVNYVGEPVVVIAAPDRETVEQAKKFVNVQYQELPAVFDVLQSENSDVKIFGENNIFKEINIENGDPERAKAEAFRTIEIETRTGFQEHLYLEPQGIVAIPQDKKITIRGSLQCPYYVKGALDTMFDGKVDINVVHVTTGGAFGGKEDYPSLIAGHAAILAWKSGRPVAIFFDREEDILFTTKRHPSVCRHKAYVAKDGTILGAEMEIYLNSGAYCTLSQVVLARAALTAANTYRIPNIRVKAKALATNVMPPGAFRGFGGPQAVFAMEMLMEKIARSLNLNPAEVRRKNLVKLGDELPTGQILKYSVCARESFEDVLERSDYFLKYKIYQKSNQEILQRLKAGDFPKIGNQEKLRGIGVSTSAHGAGFTGVGENVIKGKIRAEISPEGKVVLYSAQTEMGQGELTAFKLMFARALHIPQGQIVIANVETDKVPNSGPTVASRSTMIVGSLIVDAAEEIVRQLREKLKQKTGKDTEYREGYFYDGDSIVSFNEVARKFSGLTVEKEYQHPPIIRFDDTNWRGDAYPTYSWAAAVAEVEVDPISFEIRVTRYFTTHEIGKAINYDQSVGQIQGGSLQGIGYALYENIPLNKGKFGVTGFSDYIIPTTADTPKFDVKILEDLYPFGPFGAKGLGELPFVGAAPAVVSALWMIFGSEFSEIPVLPEDVAGLFIL